MTVGNIILKINFIKEFANFFLKTVISQGSYSQRETSMPGHLGVLQPSGVKKTTNQLLPGSVQGDIFLWVQKNQSFPGCTSLSLGLPITLSSQIKGQTGLS